MEWETVLSTMNKDLCRLIVWGEISQLKHKNKNETISFDSIPLEKESSRCKYLIESVVA